MERIIMHIDVNNAFLSWSAVELLNQGCKYDIRDSYAVIGGDEDKRHGVVLAKSMACKKMGIVTGESLYSARKKCSVLKTYTPNYSLYQSMSSQMFELLSGYSPDIEISSIDECFLDYGKVKKLYGDQLAFALRIKEEIKTKLGFTVNIGIGNNKLCAKMASDFSKPNQVHTLYINEVKSKMWILPVGQLFGIGKKTSSKLQQLNINTIGELALFDPYKLNKYFKNQTGRMIELANGVDESLVITNTEAPKGISNSTTLAYDYTNKEEIYRVINAMAENVAITLRKQQKYANVIAIILKDKYFHSYSHQQKLKNATDITSEIAETARHLFGEAWDKEPIRLIGVRLDNLVSYTNHQVSLFESIDSREKDTNLEKVVDNLKEKFGHKAIKKASSLDMK